MFNKLASLTIIITLFSLIGIAQSSLKGTVIDDKKEPLPFANITLWQNDILITGTITDFEGHYTINPVNPGTYSVKASSVGFQPMQFNQVVILSDKLKELDFTLKTGIELKEIEVKEYKNPLIEKDNTVSGGTVTREDIDKMPSKDVLSIASTIAGVQQTGEKNLLTIRGGRTTGTDFYVDGIKMRGNIAVPQSSIEQVAAYTGGIPAQFGDASGGIIQITTRSPSKKLTGSVEGITSKALDAFGYNLVSFNLSGPLIKRKDSSLNTKPILGFFLASDFEYDKDNKPSAIGHYQLKDDVLKSLETNPVSASPISSGTVSNGEFIKLKDLQHVNVNTNNDKTAFTMNGKLVMGLSNKSDLSFGGNVSISGYSGYTLLRASDNEISTENDIRNDLFNSNNNQRIQDSKYQIYGRYTYRFGQNMQDSSKTSIFKNGFINTQLSYTHISHSIQDPIHKDNYFDYGYVGKFKNTIMPVYEDSLGGGKIYHLMRGFKTQLVEFTGSDINPVKAAYTKEYIKENGIDASTNMLSVQNGGGLLNGDQPNSIYSLYNNVGYTPDLFLKKSSDQFLFSTSFSVTFKDHTFNLGISVDKLTERAYAINPVKLWTLMRLLVNNQLSQLDLKNPVIAGTLKDTINFIRMYDAKSQTTFDQNLRKLLGLSANDKTMLDIDSYNPNTFSLSMFSPDELLNNGGNSSLVNYYGYNTSGFISNAKTNLDNFFNQTDANGNYTRIVGAFEPINMAGYISDKFTYKNIIFNVGVRIERYDANQMVLKDKYSLAETYKAGDVHQLNGSAVSTPNGIGSDYVVYVDQTNHPTHITGYRNGDTWYNASGQQISDPASIGNASEGGKIIPYLVNPSNTTLSANAFKQYIPEINVMPRISFSFPISEASLFYAHYDVLSQRPIVGSRLDPIQYLFIQNMAGTVLNNPDLKPERTTDYEVGFQQRIKESSALKIAAFYREMRNMIQVHNLVGAYPVTYMTYDNIDFGTIKGISLGYDLRRTGNLRMSSSYTLQFADGTGSSETSQTRLAAGSQTTLRTINALSYDQRHTITIVLDYRYGDELHYNGPIIHGLQVLKNTGINFILRTNSGLPYTKQSNVTSDASFGISQTNLIEGSINGARTDWQFNMDMRIDRNIDIKFYKGETRRKLKMNVYFLVLNLLDNQNITNVYAYTGSANNDGYLAASQTLINQKLDPTSYRDLYNTKVNNPYFYSLPRRMRIGMILNF